MNKHTIKRHLQANNIITSQLLLPNINNIMSHHQLLIYMTIKMLGQKHTVKNHSVKPTPSVYQFYLARVQQPLPLHFDQMYTSSSYLKHSLCHIRYNTYFTS